MIFGLLKSCGLIPPLAGRLLNQRSNLVLSSLDHLDTMVVGCQATGV